MTERRRSWLPWILLALILAAACWADQSRRQAVVRAEIEAERAAEARERATQREQYTVQQQVVIDSLARVGDSLRLVAVEAKRRSRAARAQWDTLWLPGTADTLSVATVRAACQLALAADSIEVAACEAVVSSCEARVALEQERVATEQGRVKIERERGDSAVSAANGYRKAMRGPWLRPAVEGTLTPELAWQAAGEVTLGRGRFKVLARLDVNEGAETCSFVPNADAYQCSTPTEATARFGVRYGF